MNLSSCECVSCTPEDIFNLPLTEDYFVVDTRTAEAYAAGHLPTALSFPRTSAVGPELEALSIDWVSSQLMESEPEQRSKAVVLADISNGNNSSVITSIANAIASHPAFQCGRLKVILLSAEGHDSVASRYPFLVGKEWIDLPTAYPSQIQPQLFLGSDSPARDRRVFEHLNIGAVVNAARELPNFLEGDEALALSYLNMNWDDDPLQEIASGIEKALPFISMHLRAGRGVLVHCKMGQSRSASVVVAYLMATFGCGYDKALGIVRGARPMARPNEGFRQELCALEGALIYGPKQ